MSLRLLSNGPVDRGWCGYSLLCATFVATWTMDQGSQGGCALCRDVGAAFEEEGVAPRPLGQHNKYAGLLGSVPKVAAVQSDRLGGAQVSLLSPVLI